MKIRNLTLNKVESIIKERSSGYQNHLINLNITREAFGYHVSSDLIRQTATTIKYFCQKKS